MADGIEYICDPFSRNPMVTDANKKNNVSEFQILFKCFVYPFPLKKYEVIHKL